MLTPFNMKKSISGLILSITIGLLSSCYPGGPEFYEDTDVVYTSFEPEFNFQNKSTYALPDKIVKDIEIDKGDTTLVYMKDAFALPILAAIDANMQQFGWTKVDISQRPDVVLTPAAITNTTYFYSYWYSWWWGGYYPGWGWYYPPYWTVSSYTTGTMIIAMADPNLNNPINQSRASWIMLGNGLLSGAGDISRVTNAIDQAFEQSPYLKINN
jgi:hypothetical protein